MASIAVLALSTEMLWTAAVFGAAAFWVVRHGG
jgi:hypothetical protein